MDTDANFNAWLEARRQKKTTAANIVMQSSGDDPDAVARDLTLSQEFTRATGQPVPLEMVKGNRGAVERAIEDRRNSTVLGRSPRLTAWLTANPTGAAIAKDDLENLSWWETAYRASGNALSRSAQRVTLLPAEYMAEHTAGRARDRDMSFGEILADARRTGWKDMQGNEVLSWDGSELLKAGARWVDARYADLIGTDDKAAAMNYRQTVGRIAKAIENTPMSPAATRFRDTAFDDMRRVTVTEDDDGNLIPVGAGAQGWADAARFLGDVATDPAGATAFIYETALESLPLAGVGIAAGIATRNPAVGATVMGGTSYVQERYSEPAEFFKAKGIDISTPEGARRVISDPALMQEAANRGMMRGAIIGLLDGLSGGVAGKALAKSPLANMAVQSIVQAAMGGAGEAGAQLATDGTVDMREVLVEALAEYAGSPFEVAGHGLSRLRQNRAKAAAAERTRATTEQASAAAQASATRARSPETFREVVAAAMEGTDAETMYVDGRQFSDYFQSAGLDPFDWLADLGMTADDLDAAIASGGDIQIPTATFAAKVVGGEHEAFFKDHAKFNPEDFSPAEAAAFNERADEERDNAFMEAERARLEDEARRSTEQVIEEEVVSRLRAAGRSANVATPEAKLLTAFYATQAKRDGVKTEEFLARYPLPRILGDLPQGMQFRNVDELTRTLAAARARKTAKDTRQTLLEFVADRGGIKDDGGELAARDATVVKRPGKKTLRLAGKEGAQSIDKVAHAVIEAGYLTGVPEAEAYRAALVEGREVPDITAPLLEAIDAELRGTPQYNAEAGKALEESAQLDEIEGYLSSLGVSLSDTDEDIRAAIDGARQYGQASILRRSLQALLDFARRAPANETQTVDIGAVSAPVAKAIKDTTGLDVSGYSHSVDAFAIRHIFKGHGDAKKEAARGQLPITDADILSIPQVIENATHVVTGMVGRRKQAIIGYLSTAADGSILYVEEARVGKRRLAAISMRKFPPATKSNSIIAGLVSTSETLPGGEIKIEELPPARKGPFLFQKMEGGARGSIQFPAAGVGNGETIIRLSQNADLSTFIHETGHFFLAIMQDMAARGHAHSAAEMEHLRGWWKENAKAVAADGKKAMPDAKITEADVIAALENGTTGDPVKDAAIDIGMHEQFARGVEAYFMEGKAPSAELRTVFEKFSAWLTRIYRTMKGLDVTLNDDVRAVFDRMLATDEQIARARADMGVNHPLFASAAEMGLTEDEYSRLHSLRERAESADKARLLRKVMEPIRREREEWFRDERARVKQEVTASLQAQPVFRAVQELRFGKGFDGAPVAIQKLDRASIERDYGLGYAPLLPGATADGKGHRHAVFASEGGTHPDVIADIYGYPSGRELLDALASAPPIGEAIEAETERVMRERHGDALNDGSIEQEAMDALHNEDKGQWIAAELKAVADVAGLAPTLTAKEARRVAKETIDRLPVKDATAAYRYLSAERKAANEAQALARQLGREGVWMQNARRRITVKARGALRGEASVNAVAGQIDAANASTGGYNETVAKLIDAKRRQLLNHALYSEARKAGEFVGKVEDKAANLSKSDKKLGKSKNIDFIKASRAIAARFGLTDGDTAFEIHAWMEQLAFEDPATASAIAGTIQTYTRDPMPYRKMPFAELSALNDALDSILETGKRSRELEIEGRAVDKADAIAELVATLEARGLKRNPALDRELSKGEKVIRNIMGWASALKRVENWTRAMDDGEQGAYTKYIARPVMEAVDRYRTDKSDKLGKLLAIIDARRDTLTGRAITAPELNGYKFTNKAALIHAILHTGNPSNMAKLLLGRGWTSGYINQRQAATPLGKPRFRRDGSPVMTKGDLDTSAWDGFLDRMIREGTITPEDIQMVNAIWKLNEEIKRPAQATHRKLFGFYFKEIEAEGYDTAAGRLEGGYVPAVVDKDASNDGVLRDGQTALDQQAAGFLLPTAGSGFTKSRVENYTQPLALDLRLLPSHVDKVLRFTHLDPAVRQVHSLVVDRRFGNALAQYDPTIADNLLLPWLQRVAQQSVETPSSSSSGRAADAVLRTLRKKTGFNIMFANVVNTLQQVTSLSVAATLVKPSIIKNAAIRFVRDTGGMRDEVFALSPFMAERIGNASRETQMRIQDVVAEPTTFGEFERWIEKHGYFLQSAVQGWIDVPVWMAAYEQAVAGGMSERDAVFEADATIRRTMGGMNPEDVSLFESGPAWKRLFTMFYTYFNAMGNHLAERSSSIWRRHGWEGKGKLFNLYIFGVLVPAVGAELIAQAFRGELGDDDEDGAYWDDMLGLFFGSQARYGTGMVPVAGQLTQLVWNQFNDQRYDDRLSPSPAVSSLERALRSPYSVPHAVFGDGSWQTAVGDGLTAFALGTGVPANWLAKPLGYTVGVFEGRYQPEGPVDLLQGAVSGRDGTGRR